MYSYRIGTKKYVLGKLQILKIVYFLFYFISKGGEDIKFTSYDVL